MFVHRILTALHLVAPQNNIAMRKEKDSMGEFELPDSAYYGVQTARALQNYPISGVKPDYDFIEATVLIKKAAAKVNTELRQLDPKISNAIIQAADEVLAGKLSDSFVVDVYQAGAGTSHNMNVNEVLANRAIEILGGKRGDYKVVSPNDHVNCAQSTNDVIPTAIRIATLVKLISLVSVINECSTSLNAKALEFHKIIKSGRTHLKDAVPVRLGGEFKVYADMFSAHKSRIESAQEELKVLGIGGTAAGTGLNAHPDYKNKMVTELSNLTGFSLKGATNLMVAMQSMAPFVSVSGALKNFVLDLTKICNDLRLMDSGPMTGLSEIQLPPVQPGSSIMPGKVNPSMVEMLNQVCLQVKGFCSVIEDASAMGQFELNVMMPLIAYDLLEAIKILTNALVMWNEKCVKGITANPERCKRYAEKSLSNVTALNPLIGYLKAAEVAKKALETRKTIRQICLEEALVNEAELDKALDLDKQAGG